MSEWASVGAPAQRLLSAPGDGTESLSSLSEPEQRSPQQRLLTLKNHHNDNRTPYRALTVHTFDV